MKKLLLSVSLILLCLSGYGQQNPGKEADADQLIEELLPQPEDEQDLENAYDLLLQHYRSPLNLNIASRQELQSLFILSEIQINSLLQHRKKYGKLLSIYELQSVADFDLPVIYKILPFVTVQDNGLAADNQSIWQKIKEEENNFAIFRFERTLEQKKGYLKTSDTPAGTSRYAGSPNKLFARYKIAHNKNFSIGFTLEKDAGEQLIWDPATKRYGPDFMSGHAAIYNRGKLKSLIIGDYQMQFGQGLVLSGGLGIGKGSESITTIRRNSIGIRPYTSVLESGFMRGIAGTVAINPKIEVTGFYSRMNLDGITVETIGSSGEISTHVSSLSATGFHRTPTEIKNKRKVLNQLAGGNILYNSSDRNLQIGINTIFTHLSQPLQPRDYKYNQYNFRGSSNLNSSFFYSYNWQNFSFFGEAAHTQGSGSGVVNGVIASLTNTVELSMLYRNYARNFQTLYGSAFSESTAPRNEKGFYWGLKITPIRKIQLSAYYDTFKFPWLSYQADAPSGGHEWLARITYLPNKTTNLYAQVRVEVKEKNLASKINYLQEKERINYLINLDWKASKVFSFKSRVQASTVQHSALTTGYALMQDLNLDLGKLSLSTRFAIFDTDDYDNRQYVYEKNVLYAFSIPAYYGRGTRAYLLAQYNLGKKTDIWLRIARTSYKGENEIGSGLETISGNQKTDLSIQLRRKF